jgi:Mrp family chromosome partitioning ATPase
MAENNQDKVSEPLIDSPSRQFARQQIRKMTEVEQWEPGELDALKIIHPGIKNRDLLNSFRELRTQLMQKTGGKNAVCLVSSVCKGGGGSFVSLNLAATIALDISKTALLIDCNLYEPSVERLMRVTPDYGLTDYLEDVNLDVQDIIYSAGIPRLRVIPVGCNTEAGAEHFISARMGDFIEAVRTRYPDRFIIIDAPPVGLAAETRILANYCDVALLVVPYGRVTPQQIQSGIDTVGKDKVAGLVFND